MILFLEQHLQQIVPIVPSLGTMSNTSGRTYIGSKLTNASTAFSGGSVDGILVNDGTNDLMGVVSK